jgi:hypothetical protein
MADATVCFIARTDFESKPGGDTMQWQMYARAARDAGLQVTTWFDDAAMPRADVFHAFNVDRPLELYPKLLQAKQRGLPFVLSTIHRPNEWVARFRRVQPPSGLLGRLVYRSPIGRSIPASEALREAVLLVLQRRLAHLGDLVPSWTRRVRWLLANANRLALLSHAEAAYIEKDFAYTVRPEQRLLLPNWVEGVGETVTERPEVFRDLPEAPVIVIGRIEPLKNSLRVCRLAEAARRHVVFIGRPHPSEHAFAATFKDTVLASRYARWVPGIARPGMAQFYCHSSFLLNASLVEVSPMVDIEALAFGSPIATTRYALHHELLPPDTPICEPYDDQRILERLRWRPERLPPRQVIDPQQCRNALVAAYLEVAGSGVSGRGAPPFATRATASR